MALTIGTGPLGDMGQKGMGYRIDSDIRIRSLRRPYHLFLNGGTARKARAGGKRGCQQDREEQLAEVLHKMRIASECFAGKPGYLINV